MRRRKLFTARYGNRFLGGEPGALEGAYLNVIEADERKIGIEKYLLVNPPGRPLDHGAAAVSR